MEDDFYTFPFLIYSVPLLLGEACFRHHLHERKFNRFSLFLTPIPLICPPLSQGATPVTRVHTTLKNTLQKANSKPPHNNLLRLTSGIIFLLFIAVLLISSSFENRFDKEKETVFRVADKKLWKTTSTSSLFLFILKKSEPSSSRKSS